MLCEYLASLGFIVATTHPLGTAQINPRVEAHDLTTVMRDMAFVKGMMHDFPQVDPDHLGLFGWGLGSVTALWMQMQDSDVDAVAGLGGALSSSRVFDLIRDNPYFRPERMQVPLMVLCSADDPVPDPSLIDALIYSKRYTGHFPGLTGNSFTHYPILTALLTDTTGQSLAASQAVYAAIAEHLEIFFKALLNGDSAAMAALGAKTGAGTSASVAARWTVSEAREVPPTPEQFMAIIQGRGVPAAVKIFDKFRAEDPELILFQEGAVNLLGYQLLGGGQAQDAVQVLRMNRDTYPNSANVWDSYGEACVAAGNNEEAITSFRKALELLDTDSNLNAQFREGIRLSATRNLEQLEAAGAQEPASQK